MESGWEYLPLELKLRTLIVTDRETGLMSPRGIMGGNLHVPYEYRKAQQNLIRIVSICTCTISSLRGNNAVGGFHHILSLISRKTAGIDVITPLIAMFFFHFIQSFALICCQIPPWMFSFIHFIWRSGGLVPNRAG